MGSAFIGAVRRYWRTTIVTLVPLTCYAWGFQGHILVAQIAYLQLKPSVQQRIDQMSRQFIYRAHWRQNRLFGGHYPNVSTFAQLAVLPDTWRNNTLGEIYEKYGGNVPAALADIANTTTGQWHYINRRYPETPQPCHRIKPPHIVNALKKIQAAIATTTDPQTQMISLIFLAHLIGDLFQPLHTFSLTLSNGQSDAGGNLYWVYTHQNKKVNLHKIWDNGVGLLNKSKKIGALAIQLAHAPSFTRPTSSTNHWCEITTYNRQYAPEIYSVNAGDTIRTSYYIRGQQLARQQLILAGRQLSSTLNTLLAS